MLLNPVSRPSFNPPRVSGYELEVFLFFGAAGAPNALRVANQHVYERGLDLLHSGSLDPSFAKDIPFLREVTEAFRSPPVTALIVGLKLTGTDAKEPPGASERIPPPIGWDAHRRQVLRALLLERLANEPETLEPFVSISDPPTAWQAIEHFAPERIDAIAEEIHERVAAFRAPFPVVRTLTRSGNNAKTEVVRAGGRVALCKVFKVGREEFFQRELTGLQLGRDGLREVAPLLDYGDRWVLMPYYEGWRPLSSMGDRRGMLPLREAQRALFGFRALHVAGYAHMDCHAHHALVSPEKDIRIIDMDRLHRYTGEPPCFEEGYDMLGPPDTFAGARPFGYPPTFRGVWYPRLGVSLRHMLGWPTSWQRTERTLAMGSWRYHAMTRAARAAILGS